MTTTTISLELRGTEEFIKAIEAKPAEFKAGVKLTTQFLKTKVQEVTPWRTGRTARAWSSVEPIDDGYMFGNPLPHTILLEKGWDPAKKPIGPRTMLHGDGRIYSKQAPGGIVGPLIQRPDIQGLILQRIIAALKERGIDA